MELTCPKCRQVVRVPEPFSTLDLRPRRIVVDGTVLHDCADLLYQYAERVRAESKVLRARAEAVRRRGGDRLNA
jgi:hypothetical protein